MQWKCQVCGYVHDGNAPPDTCPVCGVGADCFDQLETVLIEDNQEAFAASENYDTDFKQRWRCSVCGYIHCHQEAVEKCPKCRALSEKFVKVEEQWYRFQCGECGYIHASDTPPYKCPICHANEKKFIQLESLKTRWKCSVCRYIHNDEQAPERCPICQAEKSLFAQLDDQWTVLIIGAGIAGVAAAETIMKIAPATHVVLLNAESHWPYHRLNLTRFLAGEIPEDSLPLHDESWYTHHKVNLITKKAVSGNIVSQVILLEDGSRLAYDRMILTSGAQSFIPPISGIERKNVTGLRTWSDALKIIHAINTSVCNSANKNCDIVCIGGGILGLETAAALAGRGASVTLIETSAWVMHRQLPKRAGEKLQAHLDTLGVKLRTGSSIEAIEEHGVRLNSGELLQADWVIISAGIRPNLELPIALGLKTERGVVVDDMLRTSSPHVFAAGDIAQHDGIIYGLWPASQIQGEVAAKNAISEHVEFSGLPRTNALKVLDLDVFSIGRIHPQESDVVIELDEPSQYLSFLIKDGIIEGAAFIGGADFVRSTKKAIESHHLIAAEVIRKGALAIAQSLTNL